MQLNMVSIFPFEMHNIFLSPCKMRSRVKEATLLFLVRVSHQFKNVF